jgi:hypothetical protein
MPRFVIGGTQSIVVDGGARVTKLCKSATRAWAPSVFGHRQVPPILAALLALPGSFEQGERDEGALVTCRPTIPSTSVIDGSRFLWPTPFVACLQM